MNTPNLHRLAQAPGRVLPTLNEDGSRRRIRPRAAAFCF